VGLSIGSRTPPEIAGGDPGRLIATRNGVMLERAAGAESRRTA